MASNLTGQVRNIADVTTAVANGDLRQKTAVDGRGEVLERKGTVDQLRSFASEVTRVAREVGTEGILGGQARVEGVSGVWKDLTDNVNFMASNLTTQVRGIARVVTAVAKGDLDQKFVLEAQGEVAELAETINTMVDQLRSFAAEVTRVAKEVGTEGRLGGQANVEGVSGTWKDLTENVNMPADNLTSQVRNIAEVTTAVATGDLSKKITVNVKGEILQLKNTINTMVDQLSSFADEVTRVAREVGTEGKLGGQAKVKGVSGTWKDLTDNVNTLADNLTNQVRNIAEVTTAVAKGDLSQKITVDARGEVLQLKNNINTMIRNLAETTRRNAEQDWLNSNLARFTGMMQGQRDLETVSRMIMSELTPLVGAHHGAFFIAEGDGDALQLRLISSYAYKQRKAVSNRFGIGEGLVGQAALEKTAILLTEAPQDYIRISSGLGEATPHNLLVLPATFEGQVMAVIELASFHPFSETHQAFLDQLMESVGIVINVIQQNMRAEELPLPSKYKSEFLANMSHELRTPLNSLLILAKLLGENPDGNLTDKQIEFARTIYSAGSDLLGLINDILDLSKVEAGRMDIHIEDVSLGDLREYVERTFRPIAEEKGLEFGVEIHGANVPPTIVTDEQRLQQVLKNLLSNACKFTDDGSVWLRISAAEEGTRFQSNTLQQAGAVFAFSVVDTGIGIH